MNPRDTDYVSIAGMHASLNNYYQDIQTKEASFNDTTESQSLIDEPPPQFAYTNNLTDSHA